MSDLQSVIRKHVLKNAYDYGRANAGSVAGKVIGEYPGAKSDMKATMAEISKEIARVAKLTKGEIESGMSNFVYAEKKEEKKTLELPDAAEGNVVTRFPPEPSGYPHIGHAKAAWLDFEAANAYGGKMLLRFDDTNPEKESYQFVEAIKGGLEWLGVKWHGSETFTSDNLLAVYESARKLIIDGKAYTCTCKQDQISKGRTESVPCECRGAESRMHLERWDRMIEGDFKEGEIILRFKGDLSADNTVMRDPTLARILETKHFRQLEKFRVWPSYDLAVVVMDHLEGITHSMRSKEYELRDELSLALYAALGWTPPKLIGFSRLAIKNAPISKRLLLPLVNEKKVLGWDDPRLPTLAGLKRRGILPAAIKEFVLSFGLSKVESEPDWEALLALNRKLLDPESPHFFFVPEPVELEVEGLERRTLTLKLHPKKDLGPREMEVSGKVFIPASDANSIKEGEVFRLKDLCNVRLMNKGEVLKCQIVPEGQVEKKLQWVSEPSECTVLVPKDLLGPGGEFDPASLQEVKGYCEKGCLSLAPGTVVQFERFGFCRLDRKEPLTFVYSC
ncbi:MAG TPA: glutamate--tRNA ligase [Candidatus Bilamarchaeum sp.]|nr:glutamate--tRNA ligase [Candidatus Bilamarchaeum sp.]